MPDIAKETIRPSAETSIPDIPQDTAAHLKQTGEIRDQETVQEELSSVGGMVTGEFTPHSQPTIDHSQFEPPTSKSATPGAAPKIHKAPPGFGDTSSWLLKLEQKRTEMKGLK